jgi:hypothetical protein
MNDSKFSYENFSTRTGFNTSVRHVKSTLSFIQDFSDKRNLADALNEAVDSGAVSSIQLPVVSAMVLKDKFGYSFAAKNLEAPIGEDLEKIADEAIGWNAVDMVLIYFHPDLGPIIVNPKNSDHWKLVGQLRKNELVVAYAGSFTKKADPAVCKKALDRLFSLLEGQTGKIPADLLMGDCTYRKAKPVKEAVTKPARKAPAAKKAGKPGKVSAKKGEELVEEAVEAPVAAPVAAPAAPVVLAAGSRMTPMYSVPVTNELFHNGNVEAWKRIVASFEAQHKGLTVMIYYDNERITNINSLFKWGKVKRGTSIQFVVAGVDIKDVAKLQKYLRQGASSAFEAFLVGAPSSVLNLF